MPNLNIYPWQIEQFEQLSDLAIQKKLPHALLLSGKKGVGKTEFAHHLTQFLVCDNPTPTAVCGQCQGCHILTGKNTHPDIVWLEPEGKSRQIKIDQVRQCIADIVQTPQLSRYRILIVEDADRMNLATSNALLKTLEEPPKHVLIILISSAVHALLPTIRSRCQQIQMYAAWNEATQAWLQSQLPSTIESPDILWAKSLGAPLQAKALAEESTLADNCTNIALWLDVEKGPIFMAKSGIKVGVDIVLQQIYMLASDLIKLCLNTSESELINKEQSKLLARFSKQVAVQSLLKFIDTYNENVKFRQGQSNLNEQLMLESLFIDWCAILKAAKQ